MSDEKFSYDDIEKIVVYNNLFKIIFTDGTSIATNKGAFSPMKLECKEENIGVRR